MTKRLTTVLDILKQKHLEQVPNCPYGDQPHYVPPGQGMIGFFMCSIPDDIRNHTRCEPPYDHEHELHWPA